MLQPEQRPKRFIVIPKKQKAARLGTPAQTMQLLRTTAAVVSKASKLAMHKTAGPASKKGATPKFDIVNTAPADGSILVDGKHTTLATLKANTPPGTTIVEEHWYRLERPIQPWLKLSAGLTKPRLRAGHTMSVTVKVVLEGGGRLPDALVTVLVDEAKAIGDEATTDRYGRVTFQLSDRTTRVNAIMVAPLHSGWPVRVSAVDIGPAGIEIAVPAIDLSVADVRGLVYGKPAAAGKGVKVGVVDTGIGPHSALRVAGGRNTTDESPRRVRDEDGHGTHVAGVIASTAAGWRRGEASGVVLQAYRVFESGDIYASSFAIQAAIKQAAIDGCDLISLSLGDANPDAGVKDAVEFAWERGSVCIAASGNDWWPNQIRYPARFEKAVAVGAIGLENTWPAGAEMAWTVSAGRGKALSGRLTFVAGFSNRSAKVALAAPGVAIVSTIFGNRWGAMSGTSMATPVATGVLASRLGGSPVLQMPRDALRSAAIVKLATSHAEDLGLPVRAQGSGLAR